MDGQVTSEQSFRTTVNGVVDNAKRTLLFGVGAPFQLNDKISISTLDDINSPQYVEYVEFTVTSGSPDNVFLSVTDDQGSKAVQPEVRIICCNRLFPYLTVQ